MELAIGRLFQSLRRRRVEKGISCSASFVHFTCAFSTVRVSYLSRTVSFVSLVGVYCFLFLSFFFFCCWRGNSFIAYLSCLITAHTHILTGESIHTAGIEENKMGQVGCLSAVPLPSHPTVA